MQVHTTKECEEFMNKLGERLKGELGAFVEAILGGRNII